MNPAGPPDPGRCASVTSPAETSPVLIGGQLGRSQLSEFGGHGSVLRQDARDAEPLLLDRGRLAEHRIRVQARPQHVLRNTLTSGTACEVGGSASSSSCHGGTPASGPRACARRRPPLVHRPGGTARAWPAAMSQEPPDPAVNLLDPGQVRVGSPRSAETSPALIAAASSAARHPDEFAGSHAVSRSARHARPTRNVLPGSAARRRGWHRHPRPGRPGARPRRPSRSTW